MFSATRVRYNAVAMWLASGFMLSTPALSQTGVGAPADIAALDAAAAQHDAAGTAHAQLAAGIDDENGRANPSPPLGADKYQRAASSDENAGAEYETAGKDWNELADRYKAVADAIKGFNDSEATEFTAAMTDRRKKADLSKQNAIKFRVDAAVEHDKAAAKLSNPADKVAETAAAAKQREAAGHVK